MTTPAEPIVRDPLSEFADDDLETLAEALEAWESKDFGTDILTELLDGSMSRNSGPMSSDLAAKRAEDKRQRESAKKFRKERSVLLRAKLLTIRDRRRAARMVNEALS